MAREQAAARVDPAAAAQGSHTTPYVTYTLIGANLLLFLACIVQAGTGALRDRADLWTSSIMRDGVLITGYDDVFLGEYWRLLSSGFLHWSIVHIAVNMISLYIIGRDLEQHFGPARYGVVYLTSLLGGSAAVVILERENVLTAGASGAIYGLLGAILVVVLRLKLPATSVLTIIALNIVVAFTIPGISLWAHLGGLVFGALGALAVLWLPAVALAPEDRTQTKVSVVGWTALAALLVAAIALGVGYSMALSP